MSLHAPTRTAQTERTYSVEGERHRARADRLWPVIECPVERLAVSVEADLAILRPRTLRRYRPELVAAIDALVAENPALAEAAETALPRILAALDARRGIPPVARAATRKVRDAAPKECEAVLGDLRERAARAGADLLDELLPVLVLAAPQVGVRPVEWCGARLTEGKLVVACAKATNGRACSPERPLGLAGYTPEVRAAVAQVVALMPEALSAYLQWTRLRDALAERLARACVRVGVRRLSLYSFRHAALATWKAAGLDPAVIAALAGHKTSAMQGRYAGARHGWDARDGLPEPDPELVDRIAARSTLPRILKVIATIGETPSSGSRQSKDIPTSSAQADEVRRINDTSDPKSLRTGEIEATTIDGGRTDPVRPSASAEPLGEQLRSDADLFPSFPTPPLAPSPPRMPRLSAVELFRHFSYSARLDPRPVTTIPGPKPDNYDEPSTKQISR